MIERTFDNREEWLNFRLGKASGSDLKKLATLRGDGTKPGVYRKAAESILGSHILAEDELTVGQVLQRGHDLEEPAITLFEKRTGKKVKRGLVVWESDEDPRMIVSPDGPIGKTEVVEVKSFLGPKHVEAIMTGDFPENTGGYEEQRLQHFIVNPKLKKHHTAFYHPSFPPPFDLFIVTRTRKDLEADIEKFHHAEKEAVAKVREIVNALTMYSPEEVARMRQVREELLADAGEAHAADLKKVQKLVTPKTPAV